MGCEGCYPDRAHELEHTIRRLRTQLNNERQASEAIGLALYQERQVCERLAHENLKLHHQVHMALSLLRVFTDRLTAPKALPMPMEGGIQ